MTAAPACTPLDSAGAGRGLHAWEQQGEVFSCTNCGARLIFDETIHAYFAAGRQLVSVSEFIAPLNAIIYRDANPLAMASRASLGHAVHTASVAIDRGEPPGITNGYTDAYTAYLEDHTPDYLAIEHPVLDLEAGYAGTIDRIIRHSDGTIEIMDLKTSTVVHPGLYAMQLWGYACAAGLPRARLSVLHLREDGTYTVHDLTPGDARREEYEETWQALATLRRWLNRHRS